MLLELETRLVERARRYALSGALPVKPLIVFLLGFGLRAAIILTNPIIWGTDAMMRLFDRHALLKGHQLPMLQLMISGVSIISTDPMLVRLMMALIGAAAGLGFYWLTADLFGEKVAFPAALLFVTHPYVLAASTVPNQEILMLASLFFAFHFFNTERWWAASACLAVASLTRHEAWAACPVLALTYVLRGERTVAGAVKAALLFGWMPVLWVLAQRGLAPTGHFVAEPIRSVWRLQRLAYIGWVTTKFTPIPVLALCVAGALRIVKQSSQIDWRLWMQIAFVALIAIALLFSAHGGTPDPERYVSSHEAHIPIYLALLISAVGFAEWPRWNRAIVATSMIMGIAGAAWYVHYQSSFPDVQLDFRVARYLDRSLKGAEHALILATPIKAEMARTYLDKARETGGEDGFRQARAELQEMSRTPPDYQRVVVHSQLGRERLIASPVGCSEWVALWNDYPVAFRDLDGAAPVDVLRCGPLSVTLFKRQCAR